MLSIKTKLLGTILPLTIIIVLVLTGISYFISKSIISSYSENLLSSSIENQSNEIEAWLNENLSSFQVAKKTIEQTKPDDAALKQILNGYCGFNDNYPDGLYIADENGTLITADDSSKKDSDPTSSVWYKDGLTRVNMRFTDAYTNEDGDAVISASGILNDGSDTLKVISADLSLDRISIIVNSFIEMDDAQAFLVNPKDGSILAHRDSSMISTRLSDSGDAFLKDVGAKVADGDYSLTKIDGNMTAFSEISGTDWILVSYIPTSIIYKDVNKVRTDMILVGLYLRSDPRCFDRTCHPLYDPPDQGAYFHHHLDDRRRFHRGSKDKEQRRDWSYGTRCGEIRFHHARYDRIYLQCI